MDFSLKYYKTSYLITLILALSTLVDYLLSNYIFPYLDVLPNEHIIRAPSNSVIIGIIIFLYDKYLWKFPLFNFLVKTPNMNGRYKGNIEYNFQGQGKKQKECYVEIIQTASKIKIYSYFNNQDNELTDSKSLVENILEEEDGHFGIYLFYLNNGSKIDGGLDCHDGANYLKFISTNKENNSGLFKTIFPDKEKKLNGHYFTNRQIQTRGLMKLTFLSKKLKGTF